MKIYQVLDKKTNREKVVQVLMQFENFLEFENARLTVKHFDKNKLSIVIFYTEILTRKVVLWSFFKSETCEKIHNSTFRVKISV